MKLSTFFVLAVASGNTRHPAGTRAADATIPPGAAPGLDQTVMAPPASLQPVAVLTQPASNTGTWVIVSGTLLIDGTAYPGTLTSNSILSCNWDTSSVSNPSEHTISATAQIQFKPNQGATGAAQPISSLSAPPPASGPYSGFYGDGRVADFVIADAHLKSLQFTGNVGITQNQTTPVSTPEFTWDPSTGNSKSSSPAAYVQGKNVVFTLTLCDSKGAALMGKATMGYTLKLQANPNGIVAATGQPTPSVTLFDNTTASPVAPSAFTGSWASVTATTALNGYVAGYTTTSAPVNLYAEFTHVTPAPTWGAGGTYSAFGTKIYALVATPTAPMATPWVPVLDYACQWATGSTDATSAAMAVCNGFYKNAYYNPTNQPWYTDKTTPETFHLLNFLNKTLGTSSASSGLQGQCNDFSDFLVCLSTSLGAKSLQSQQSNGGFNYSHVIYAGATGTHIPIPDYFYYHQWATDGSATSGNVFDSAVRPDSGSVTVPVNEALSPYLTWLSPGTSLTAQSPFTPQIAN